MYREVGPVKGGGYTSVSRVFSTDVYKGGKKVVDETVTLLRTIPVVIKSTAVQVSCKRIGSRESSKICL